jgi:hypothetical protein
MVIRTLTLENPMATPVEVLSSETVQPAGVQASVVVAVVILSIRPDAAGRPRLQVLLVRRAVQPFRGYWSLPGGKLWGDEALDEAAWRQLARRPPCGATWSAYT